MWLSRFANQKVFITGHTGFKGAWLCQWLVSLGARVRGFSLSTPTSPSLFEDLGLANQLDDERGDIRDLAQLQRSIESFQPDFVFHLAAQPLVRRSYAHPVETYQANAMGTVHLLEGLRALRAPCVAIIATTDKCYENREWHHGYRESDPLGGSDPYSSSKAMAELAVAAYRRSFFEQSNIAVATVRAGNVIGGGDWAEDRIIPDCVRALLAQRPPVVRNPDARRPWQHVLEPLGGYLRLAAWMSERLCNPGTNAQPHPRLNDLCGPFNFGPEGSSNRTVRDLVQHFLQAWPNSSDNRSWENQSPEQSLHEAMTLHLSIDKARQILSWQPLWDFETTVRRSADWYFRHRNQESAVDLTLNDLHAYQTDMLRSNRA